MIDRNELSEKPKENHFEEVFIEKKNIFLDYKNEKELHKQIKKYARHEKIANFIAGPLGVILIFLFVFIPFIYSVLG